MTPAYQFVVGDVIRTYDDRIGIVVDRTNAHNHLALNPDITGVLIETYMNIAIYKVLIDSTITYVNESNISEVIQWEKEST